MNTNYVYPSAQVGEFRNALLYGSGPASYAAAGDPVNNPGANEYINFPFSVLSLSGNYRVDFQPAATGFNIVRAGAPSPSQSGWTAQWSFSGNLVGGGSPVLKVTGTGGSGMTAGSYALSFSGGGGSGAAGTIVVTGSAITSITITDPGTGYTSAPTVSAATGGTPPTLTAVLATAPAPVGAGANLSLESVQFGALISSL